MAEPVPSETRLSCAHSNLFDEDSMSGVRPCRLLFSPIITSAAFTSSSMFAGTAVFATHLHNSDVDIFISVTGFVSRDIVHRSQSAEACIRLLMAA